MIIDCVIFQVFLVKNVLKIVIFVQQAQIVQFATIDSFLMVMSVSIVHQTVLNAQVELLARPAKMDTLIIMVIVMVKLMELLQNLLRVIKKFNVRLVVRIAQVQLSVELALLGFSRLEMFVQNVILLVLLVMVLVQAIV